MLAGGTTIAGSDTENHGWQKDPAMEDMNQVVALYGRRAKDVSSLTRNWASLQTMLRGTTPVSDAVPTSDIEIDVAPKDLPEVLRRFSLVQFRACCAFGLRLMMGVPEGPNTPRCRHTPSVISGILPCFKVGSLLPV